MRKTILFHHPGPGRVLILTILTNGDGGPVTFTTRTDRIKDHGLLRHWSTKEYRKTSPGIILLPVECCNQSVIIHLRKYDVMHDLIQVLN